MNMRVKKNEIGGHCLYVRPKAGRSGRYKVTLKNDFTLELEGENARYGGNTDFASHFPVAEPKLGVEATEEFAHDVAAWAYDRGFREGVKAANKMSESMLA